MLAANEIDALQSLATNWPILALVVSVIGWFIRCVAQPLTQRHLTFIDGLEARDKVTTENSIKQTVLIESLFGESKDNTSRLSRIEHAQSAAKCAYTQAGLCPPLQPKAGG